MTLAWLSKVTGALVTSVGAAWYARLVIDCARRRRALVAAEAVRDAVERGTPDVAARAVAVFAGIGGGDISATDVVRAPAAPSTTSIVSGALDLL